jgi:hypothetical protein
MKKVIYRKQPKNSCSCQLISAINANIFLGGKNVSNELYEKLVDITNCRNGTCLGITKAYPILGLRYENGPKGGKRENSQEKRDKFSPKWIEKHLPVEISTYDDKMDFHSSLIVKVKDGKVKIINHYKKWFTWEGIKDMLPAWRCNRRCRSFYKG